MQISFTDTERVLLRQAQYACQGKAGYVPVPVLLMLDHGRPAAAIAQDLGLDESTVHRYAQACQRQGLAALLAKEAPGYAGRLSSSQLLELRAEIGRTLYTDCRQLVEWLFTTYGLVYTVLGLTDLLHHHGFCYKLTTAVPCQADVVRQTAFVADTLTPLLAAAQTGEAVVYFADAAHPTHNTRATYVWTEKGAPRPLLTVSGRERVNLNAALNALMPTQVHLDETDCVNAQSTQRLYEKLLAAHPTGPVYVICDNARYYQNKDLAAWLTGTRLVQVFLPTYSPNLHLVERLWKLLRQKIIDPRFYRTKGAFRTAVLSFFTRLDEFGPTLASLMSLRFHILDAQVTS